MAGVRSKGSHLGFSFVTGLEGIDGLMTHELRVESKTSAFGQLGGKWAAGQREALILVLRNAECVPGLSLGRMFIVEVSDLGATERGQQLMVKVLLLAQLEVKPRLVGCGFSFPCWHWRVDRVFAESVPVESVPSG